LIVQPTKLKQTTNTALIAFCRTNSVGINFAVDAGLVAQKTSSATTRPNYGPRACTLTSWLHCNTTRYVDITARRTAREILMKQCNASQSSHSPYT